MKTSLSIIALVCSIVGIFLPLWGVYLVALSLLLAGIVIIMGDKIMPIITWCISLINILFLSPLLHEILFKENLFIGLASIFFLLPIISLFFAKKTIENIPAS